MAGESYGVSMSPPVASFDMYAEIYRMAGPLHPGIRFGRV